MVKKEKKALKSGRDRTGTTSLKKRITWPHEVIYRADGHLATYKELTVSPFMRAYLMVLKEVKASQVKDRMVLHLEELMEYQLEQSRCDWMDDEHRVKLRRALVWHYMDIYDWGKVKSFHTAWMNQLEQSRWMMSTR